MGKLKDLDFSDIYVGSKESFLGGVTGESDPIPTPGYVREEVLELRELCESMYEKDGKHEFAIRFDGVTFRASLLQSISEQIYVLRRFSNQTPEFSQLGFSKAYLSRLMQKGIAGMIIVAGAFGQGKTTTASSLMMARLETLGGVGITIEDPPEMPLEGRHGEGVCYQTWVEKGGFGQACRNAARWAPSIIFVGEIRDGEAAIEALRASMNGRLVICTFHADNVQGAFERLYSIALSGGAGAEDVASMMAHGIHSVIHQKLEFAHDGRKNLRVEGLFVKETGFEGVASVIRGRRFEQIGSDIMRQANLFLMETRSRP